MRSIETCAACISPVDCDRMRSPHRLRWRTRRPIAHRPTRATTNRHVLPAGCAWAERPLIAGWGHTHVS